MKKKLALVLVVAMTASLFAFGCSKKEEEKATTTKQQETTTEEATTEEPTTAAPEVYEPVTESSTESYSFGSEALDNGFWLNFSEYYNLKGDFEVEFVMDAKGGTAVWENFATVVTTEALRGAAEYKEYAVTRLDPHGWGGGDLKTVDGNDMTFSGYQFATAVDAGTEADAFVAVMKEAEVTVTITRKGNDFTVNNVAVGANGQTATTSVTYTTEAEEGVSIFFVSEKSYVTVKSFTVK